MKPPRRLGPWLVLGALVGIPLAFLLPEGEDVLLITAFFVLLVAGILRWGYEFWRSKAAEQPTGSRRSSGARLVFVAEVGVIGASAVAFFLVAVLTVGVGHGMCNAQRVLGFLTLGLFLVASVLVLLLAVKRWTRHDRFAHVMPLLVIAAAVVTLGILTVASNACV